MAEKGHTELPWHFDELGPHRTADGCGYIRSQADNLEISHHGDMGRSREENLANANLIVTAVNTYPAVEGLVKALEGARQFITNGIELGYIRMPDSDTPDPAHQRLPQIEAALSRFRSLQNGSEA